jgi:hypothetical protein
VALFQHAAEQYFQTLCLRYAQQVDEEAARKQAEKLQANKLAQRKRAKQARRITAWPAFQQRHNIHEDLTYLIDLGYMSDEDGDYGNVSEEVWNTEANKVLGPGQRALEIKRLPWRTEKVSKILLVRLRKIYNILFIKLIRFYYALDKEYFSTDNANK